MKKLCLLVLGGVVLVGGTAQATEYAVVIKQAGATDSCALRIGCGDDENRICFGELDLIVAGHVMPVAVAVQLGLGDAYLRFRSEELRATRRRPTILSRGDRQRSGWPWLELTQR